MKNIIIALCSASLLLIGTFSHAATVDLLVLYIDEATKTNNGKDINARIASYVEYSNQAYRNSDVDITLRLVGAEKIPMDYTNVNSGNLNAVQRNNDIAKLRSKYGADLVTLLNLRERTNGGSICGIGYVPNGRSTDGKFYSNAPALGFSLVGIDCGLNTFTHELGHNMSLGHSKKQGSNGGIYPWAVGHGVDGVFATIMAYPHVFGTRNQLPIFSTPSKTCSGLDCGVDRSKSNGADSARNLNLLADQISGFVGTVNSSSSGGNTGGSSSGGGETPVTPTCPSQKVNGNLITNGEFSNLNGWSDLFNRASLAVVKSKNNCIESLLRVGNRSEYYGGAFFNFGDRLKIKTTYALKGKFSVIGADRSNMRFVLRLDDSDGLRYQYLDNISVTKNELSNYSTEFEIESDSSLKSVGLHIYGPDAGVDILADKLSLVAISEEPEPIDPVSAYVINEQFEGSATGWKSYFTTRLAYSTTAAEGRNSIVSDERRYNYSGPGFTATGALEANNTYTLSTQIRISSNTSSELAQIWVYYVDDRGGHWTRVASTNLSTGIWHNLNGDLTLKPTGALTQVRVHVLGPQPNASFRIDNVRAKLK